MRLLGVILAPLLLLSGLRASPVAAEPGSPPPPPRPTELQKALEEFRVATRALGLRADSPPAARLKQSQAAKYHGRIYENLRNDILDAVPHEIRQGGQGKNLLRRNQFGFNIGGPAGIPRLFTGLSRSTFFSVNYEGLRERISRSSLRTVPTAPERQGDFSSTVDSAGGLLAIYDPGTTAPNPAFDSSKAVATGNLQYLRQPFPGNRIPQNRLNSRSLDVMKEYPPANASVGPFLRNNYFVVSPETNVANGMIVRLDHTAGKHRVDFTTAFSNGLAGSARIFPTSIDPAAPDRKFSSRSASIRHTWTISPGTVNTLAASASTDGTRNTATAGPVYTFGPYTSAGRLNPYARNTRNGFAISNLFSRRAGKHTVRMGAGYSKLQLNTLEDAAPLGLYRFGSGLTSLPGIVNTGRGLASFLLGLPERVERSRVQSPSYFRGSRSNVSFSDRWEVTRSLTLAAALNYEVMPPRVEKYNRQSTVDLKALNPATGRPGALLAAGVDGAPAGFQQVRHNLEPSASLAWNLLRGKGTVLRISWSRSVSSISLQGGQFGTQGFNAYSTWISANSQLDPAFPLGAPFPLVNLPNLKGDAVNNMVADLVDRSSRQPVIQATALSLEHAITPTLIVSGGAYRYTGADMLVGAAGVNVNGIPLSALAYRDQLNDEPFRRSLRPYSQYLGFDTNGQWAAGHYERDSSWLRLEKRTSAGLGMSASYEYGIQMDDYSGPYGVQDPYDQKAEWSRTVGFPPQRLTLTYMYELPVGPGKLLLPWSDWRRYVVEGWTLSGMTSWNGGDPLYLRPQFNNTGGVIDALRVDVVPGVDPAVADRGPDLWFNPAAFAQPADFTAGNGPRTHPSLFQPGTQNHDLSVTKRFSLHADRAVEFSAVGFNWTNHANWNDPDMMIGPASAPNVNAGKIIGSRGSRVVQLGLRYSF